MLKKAKDDLARNEFLVKQHALTDVEYQNYKYTYDKENKNLEIAEQK